MGKRDEVLSQVFERPTRSTIKYSAAVKLIEAFGGRVAKGKGSRRKFIIGARVMSLHEPHPGKELKKYQVENLRAWLDEQGIRTAGD